MTSFATTFTSSDAPEILSIPPYGHKVFVESGHISSACRKTTSVHVGVGGTLLYVFAVLDNHDILHRMITLELDRDARMEFLGLIVGRDDGSVTLRLREQHRQGASWARTTVHSVLSGMAQLTLNGLVAITPSANGSDGLFEGRALLLNKGTHASIIPSLEIEAPDVKATHATAVGPLRPDELFALQARGCTLEEARALLVGGFLNAVIVRIPDVQMQKDVRATLGQQNTSI